MNNSSTGEQMLFVLGAGFSVDAASEAGNPIALSSGHPAKYPLVRELVKSCFGMDSIPPNKSIEDLFQDSIDKGEKKPLETLYDMLMEADYYISPCLKKGGSHQNNVYTKFLRDFPTAPLLTFNYDSLPEILLLAEGAWCPTDGYGVPVQVSYTSASSIKTSNSLRPVLHLHGSTCVYPLTFDLERQDESGINMMKYKEKPEFIFDPDSLGNCFVPFERVPPRIGYKYVSDRVIAPIQNKAKDLNEVFIKYLYRKAAKVLHAVGLIVVIGYSFNRYDHVSYAPLLNETVCRKILVVAPDADTIINRLIKDHPNIRWKASSWSFRDWVNKNYPGIM
jgi:hypothetical protein